MFWDLLGGLIGALLYGIILFNVVLIIINIITRYKMFKSKAYIVSLCVSLLITVFAAESIYSWNMVLVGHMPALVVVFLWCYMKTVYQKCPHCAERIKADATKCKHCHSLISEAV